MAGAWYCSRQAVKRALDVKETARSDGQIDRAIGSASRSIEGLLRRTFLPVTATRHFRWPPEQPGKSYRLWLDSSEAISLTTLVAGGVTIAAADYFLEPANEGPPFSSIEIDLSSSASFSSGDTSQRAIVATGLFGYRNDEDTVGALSGSLAASESATASITFTVSDVGVGDILRIDSERVIVTALTMVDSAQGLGGAGLTARDSDVTVPVTDGTAFGAGMVLLIDAERMLVVDVAGNNLVVRRAWDGSVLATHAAAADIYTLTGVDVARAQLGTTLAVHSDGAAVYRFVVPELIRDLCIAEAVNTLAQEQSGYSRTPGSGETAMAASGAGLADIRNRAVEAHGRRYRGGAI